jgi:gamma-glutamyltranspeptidase/glutathione hydrolase
MNIRQFKFSLGLAVLIALAGCEQHEAVVQESPTAAKQVVDIVEQVVSEPAKEFAIAIPEVHAAEAVRKVLASGGNAVDAAVVAGFALAVTFPEAGNIGGGGFMLARMNGHLSFLDYREKAPLAASRDMYLDAAGKVVENSSLIGTRAAGVPGTVAGLWHAHQKYGSKPWAELLEPAIELAKNGYIVDPKTAGTIAETVEWFDGQVNFEQHFGVMQKGGLFKQPSLADTLARLAVEGPSDFYQGETAKLIVAQMQRGGGLITAQDLAAYQAVWRAPISAQWREYTVVSAPPPSSGGFAVIQLLKMKELLRDEFAGVKHNSAAYVHLVAEMEKRVFADRAKYFGDPDFVNVPIDQLISDAYIARRASEVNLTAISDLGEVKPGLNTPSTTHFSIIDQWGNAVSNTYTINWAFGSGVVVEGAGFLLNNEMDDFSTKAGMPNVYGVVGGVANEIQPSKRMLSSMSPTLLIKDDKVDMVVGTPGGSTIFTSVFQAIVNIKDFGMTAEQAVAASRFHHQLLPPELITESISLPLPEQTKLALLELGYRVEPHAWEFGDLQVITQSNGRLTAASDPRGIGASLVMEIAPPQ